MINLGLSPNAIKTVLQRSDWIEVYKTELNVRCTELNASDFSKAHFALVIKSHLKEALKDGSSDESIEQTLRDKIQRWMLISVFKSQSLIRLLFLIPDELTFSKEVLDKYKDIPIGPQDSDVVDKMSEEDLDKWQEGNIARFFSGLSINNLLGLFVSELFFTFEAMARVICIGTCLEFSIKSVLPNIIIQHDEINRTLRRLGDEDRQRVSCKLCPLKNSCKSSLSYHTISRVYELFYHLRAIKDYRLEFYFQPELRAFLVNEYLPKGFQIACIVDEVLDRIFSSYMTSPMLLADYKKKIDSVFNKIRT